MNGYPKEERRISLFNFYSLKIPETPKERTSDLMGHAASIGYRLFNKVTVFIVTSLFNNV